MENTDPPLEDGMSIRDAVASFPDGAKRRPEQPSSAPGPLSEPMPDGWSPQDELAGGEGFFGELIGRSEPFALRLNRERGWPSEG